MNFFLTICDAKLNNSFLNHDLLYSILIKDNHSISNFLIKFEPPEKGNHDTLEIIDPENSNHSISLSSLFQATRKYSQIRPYLLRQFKLFSYLAKSSHTRWKEFLETIFFEGYLDNKIRDENTNNKLKAHFIELKVYLYLINKQDFNLKSVPEMCGLLADIDTIVTKNHLGSKLVESQLMNNASGSRQDQTYGERVNTDTSKGDRLDTKGKELLVQEISQGVSLQANLLNFFNDSLDYLQYVCSKMVTEIYTDKLKRRNRKNKKNLRLTNSTSLATENTLQSFLKIIEILISSNEIQNYASEEQLTKLVYHLILILEFNPCLTEQTIYLQDYRTKIGDKTFESLKNLEANSPA